MTFNQAYEIAMQECGFMQHATEVVKAAIINGEQSPCYQFAIGGEAFYFGFDGVKLHKGKHSAKRSAQLINRGDTWIIRN